MYNGEIIYVIMYGDEGKFVINVIFGIILIVEVLDCEIKDFYMVNWYNKKYLFFNRNLLIIVFMWVLFKIDLFFLFEKRKWICFLD